MKKYLITLDGCEPFFTDRFTPENHFEPGLGMVVYNLWEETYTTDGEAWYEIEEDHL